MPKLALQLSRTVRLGSEELTAERDRAVRCHLRKSSMFLLYMTSLGSIVRLRRMPSSNKHAVKSFAAVSLRCIQFAVRAQYRYPGAYSASWMAARRYWNAAHGVGAVLAG